MREREREREDAVISRRYTILFNNDPSLKSFFAKIVLDYASITTKCEIPRKRQALKKKKTRPRWLKEKRIE